MNTVFIGGSRAVSRLPTHAQERLNNVIQVGAKVIVGDAKWSRQSRPEIFRVAQLSVGDGWLIAPGTNAVSQLGYPPYRPAEGCPRVRFLRSQGSHHGS